MHYYRHDENLYILNTKNWKVISYKLAMKRWIQANVNTETISIYTLIIRIRMRFDAISKMLKCCSYAVYNYANALITIQVYMVPKQHIYNTPLIHS